MSYRRRQAQELFMVNRTAIVIGTVLFAGVATRAAAQGGSAVASFDARAEKHRGGVYFTGDDIRKRSPARLSDLFRGQSGITLSTNDAGKVILTSSRGARTTLDGASMRSGVAGSAPAQPSEPMALPPVTGVRCPVAIGMDGQMMDASFSIDDVPVSGVHGVELYTGSARVPVEFGAGNNTGCGVVMVWSKTGSDKP